VEHKGGLTIEKCALKVKLVLQATVISPLLAIDPVMVGSEGSARI
jgi:hypothetical protein